VCSDLSAIGVRRQRGQGLLGDEHLLVVLLVLLLRDMSLQLRKLRILLRVHVLLVRI
jgi:hypothetical protein